MDKSDSSVTRGTGKKGLACLGGLGNNGVTMIEILVVVVIIGLMAAIAIPTFISWFPKLRFRDTSRNMYFDMQMAKAAAIKRNANVVLVFNENACPGLPDSVPDPGGGYSIFIDDGSGGGVANDDTLNGGEETLKSVTMPANVALCDSDFTGDLLAFLPTGIPKGLTATQRVQLRSDHRMSADISVTIPGRIRYQ